MIALDQLNELKGFTYDLISELTDEQLDKIDEVVSSRKHDDRTADQQLDDTVRGLHVEFSFRKALTNLGIITIDPADWWHDFVMNHSYVDHKGRFNGKTYTQSYSEVVWCAAHPELEIIYACTDFSSYDSGYGTFRGAISSRSTKWRPGKNGTRYIFENEL